MGFAYTPDRSAVEEFRENITEVLGEPNETIVDALLNFASREIARVAGAEMTARWRAEDDLKARVARVETLADHYAAQVREVEDGNGGPIPWTNTMANVVSHLRQAIAEPKPPKGFAHDPNEPSSEPTVFIPGRAPEAFAARVEKALDDASWGGPEREDAITDIREAIFGARSPGDAKEATGRD